jgi:hypothetical protein
MHVNYRLEVLRKRKRWAQKEAELRTFAKEQERKKADTDAKGKAKNQNSKVEQISYYQFFLVTQKREEPSPRLHSRKDR